ncbi:MAG: hypothetical protein AB7I04_11490 [Pseudomonadales bacterium]
MTSDLQPQDRSTQQLALFETPQALFETPQALFETPQALFETPQALVETPPELSGKPQAPASPAVLKRRTFVNPHLLMARQLSRRIRRLPDHSPEETRIGLAICQALKAYLDDQADRPH